MTIIPEYRTCPKCKKKYSFNPAIKKGLLCPHCGDLGKSKPLLNLFQKK